MLSTVAHLGDSDLRGTVDPAAAAERMVTITFTSPAGHGASALLVRATRFRLSLAAFCCLLTLPAHAQVVSKAEIVARVTGAPLPAEQLICPNRTDRDWRVGGTDLGIVWDGGQGKVLFAFGDTYADPGGGAGPSSMPIDWRSNTLARSDDRVPADGLQILSMASDVTGRAKELLSKDPSAEVTVIPTAGIAVGNRQVLHFMSVTLWGPTNGRWSTRHAGLAYSDDLGENWSVAEDALWQNDPNGTDPFQMAAFARDGGYVYMFGTENGRFGDVHLARVPEEWVLQKAAYEYWTGDAWELGARSRAAPVVAGPVGELSVVYNRHFERWLMSYLNEDRAALVVRSAPTPVGPWTGEQILITASELLGPYGAFMHPWFADGPELYFLSSSWEAYNVFWLRAGLACQCQ